jgi:hypothetical protein
LIQISTDELIGMIDVIGEEFSLEYNIKDLFEEAGLNFLEKK